jgi:hypothetical protein
VKLTRRRVVAARALAVVADSVQLGLLPVFVEGWLSPLNDVLDVVVALVMTALVGWHWAFVPAFIAELVPVLGLVPTWTAAAFLATRGANLDTEIPPGPRTPEALASPKRPERRLP